MAFCRKCGKEIDDEAVVCVHCGVAQYNNVPGYPNANYPTYPAPNYPNPYYDPNNPYFISPEQAKANIPATLVECLGTLIISWIGIIIGLLYLKTGKTKAGKTLLIGGILVMLTKIIVLCVWKFSVFSK